MPLAAPKPCSQPGCNVLAHDGTSRCTAHKVKRDSFGDKHRGSRHERGYGTAWDKARLRVLRRDAGICQLCLADGRVHRGTEVDHRVPKFEGGTDDDENLQTICRPRHREKTQQEAARARGGASPEAPAVSAWQAGGGQKSGAAEPRTDRLVKFSRAGVLEGGVPPVGVKGGT